MACLNLDNVLSKLETDFVSNYIDKYVTCGLTEMLDDNKLSTSNTIEAQNVSTNNKALKKALNSIYNPTSRVTNQLRLKGIGPVPEELGYDGLSEEAKATLICDWNVNFRKYVVRFVELAFNSAKEGSGTAFIEEYEKVQKDFETAVTNYELAKKRYAENPNLTPEQLIAPDMKGGADQLGFTQEERGHYNEDWVSSVFGTIHYNERGQPIRDDAGIKVAFYKYTMWTILLLLLFYVIGGSPETMNFIRTGFNSIVSGECSNAAYFILGRFGIQHPLCTMYKDVIRTLFNAFFLQSSEALVKLSINLAQLIVAPTFGFITINIFICTIGKLLPIFDENEKHRLDLDMQNGMIKMSGTRDAIISTLTSLIRVFSNIVTNTDLNSLRRGDNDNEIKVAPSRTAKALLDKGVQLKTEAQQAAQQAAAERERAAAAEVTAAADTLVYMRNTRPGPGGKKSRRRRRRGRKSRKH